MTIQKITEADFVNQLNRGESDPEVEYTDLADVLDSYIGTSGQLIRDNNYDGIVIRDTISGEAWEIIEEI